MIAIGQDNPRRSDFGELIEFGGARLDRVDARIALRVAHEVAVEIIAVALERRDHVSTSGTISCIFASPSPAPVDRRPTSVQDMATPEPRVEMVSDGAFDLVPRRLWTWPGGSRTMLSSRAGSQMTDLNSSGCGAIRRSPGRSAGTAVAANRKPAKFRIAATIPVSLALEDASEQALWEELDRLTPAFLSRWSDVRDAGAGLAPRTPSASLLDLCRELAWRMLGHCNFCRWDCRVDRREATKLGACKLGSATRVSSHFHHPGEELVYRGLDGSGDLLHLLQYALRCQNGDISTDKDNGEPTDARTLATMAWLLRMEGCHNVNWVGGDPTIHLHTIVAAIALSASISRRVRRTSEKRSTKSDRLHWFDRRPEQASYAGAFNVPMLWNSNFFMTPETMKILRLLIDVWLPDFKFGPGRCAMSLAKTPWYWETVTGNLAHIHDCGEFHHPAPGHAESRRMLHLSGPRLAGRAHARGADQHHGSISPGQLCDPRAAKYRPQCSFRVAPPPRNCATLTAAREPWVAVRDVTFEKYATESRVRIGALIDRPVALQMPARADQPLPTSPFAAAHEWRTNRVVRALPVARSRKFWPNIAVIWRQVEEGVRARFSSADLRGMSFTGMNLRRARFDHAQLAGADFADLEGQSDRR